MTALEQLTILGSRRAYEFSPDALRLTALSTAPVRDLIGETFQFESGGVEKPPATFGPEPTTTPPGLVFNLGTWLADDVLTPIRYLYVERNRVVIGVAAPSSTIDPIFERLRDMVNSVELADGAPILGDVRNTLDHSEISARFSFPLRSLIAPSVLPVIDEAMPANVRAGASSVLPVMLRYQLHDPSEEYHGLISNPTGRLEVSLRAGSPPEDCIYFSSAFLDSAAHTTYLERLNMALSEA